MKNLLSNLFFGILFLGLAALAFLSAPRNGDVAAKTTTDDVAAISANVAGSATNNLLATNKYNFVAIPLDSTASVTPFKAAGLATYVGAEAKAILEWNAGTQAWKTHTVGSPFNNFDLAIGGSYLIAVDATADPVLTFVGDVPAQGSISFTLAKGATCQNNSLSIPLDQASITNAAGLATAIGGIDKVLSWDAGTQAWKTHTVGSPFNNFDVKIGYPFFVCANNSAPTSWP